MKGFDDRSREQIGNIYHFGNIYSLDKNIGNAYNAHMMLLPNDNDWGVITDGDTMFLINDYGHQIEAVINKHPDAGIITCLASRTGTGPQKYREIEGHGMSNNPSMRHHRKIAEQLKARDYDQVKEIPRLAGFLMVIRKGVWKEAGGFKENCGIPNVDRWFCRDVAATGRPLLCMTGLYMLHFYRLTFGGTKYWDHVK